VSLFTIVGKVPLPNAEQSNLLLSALPPDQRQAIMAKCETVSLPIKQIIHRSGDPITTVYFPAGGFFSVLTELESGDMIEVATIGREGMAGSMALLDSGPVHSVTMVQGEMERCHQLRVADFRAALADYPAFASVVGRYTKALLELAMQSTGCNALHPAEQRLARWLLMAHDRMGRDEFAMTQEFMAMMLGVSRPTVTIVAGALQKAGIIVYRRGVVTVASREQLEAASCECYQASRVLLGRVFSTGV
jgi:CRP-like cAMP-binding protein